jgi:orotate phosphoribosyltransferase
MKNVDDLIASAQELAAGGLSRGEIADELNVSRETARWLVGQQEASDTAAAGAPAPAGADIHVDWSAIGRDSYRLAQIGAVMADLLRKADVPVDLTVGVEKAGVPLATVIAETMDTDLAAYTPAKHHWEEGDIADLGGSFSRNFATIRGRDCYIVDDTITSGTTVQETVDAIREEGGEPVACVVIVDKQGLDSIDGVPVYSLIDVVRVDRTRG